MAYLEVIPCYAVGMSASSGWFNKYVYREDGCEAFGVTESGSVCEGQVNPPNDQHARIALDPQQAQCLKELKAMKQKEMQLQSELHIVFPPPPDLPHLIVSPPLLFVPGDKATRKHITPVNRQLLKLQYMRYVQGRTSPHALIELNRPDDLRQSHPDSLVTQLHLAATLGATHAIVLNHGDEMLVELYAVKD